MLTLHFHKTNTFIGKAIRFITRGSVNHVSIETPDFIFEASIKYGVIRWHKEDFNKSTIVKSISFEIGEIDKTLDFLYLGT